MTLKHKLSIAAVVLGSGLLFTGCGSDDDDGDGGGSPTVTNPDQPSGGAVPDSFTNSATSNADLKLKTNKVQTEIVGEAKADLGLSLHGLPKAVHQFLTQNDGQTGGADVGESMDDIGLDAFAEGVTEGADCTGLVSALESSDQYFTSFFTQISSQSSIGEDFTVDTTAAQSGYAVEQVSTEGSKYAWHIKLAPTGDGPLAAFFPKMELAAGATDTEVAGLMISEMNIDTDAMAEQNGGQAEGGQSTKMDMKTAIELYANIETKTASIGIAMDMNTSGTDQPTTMMNMISDVTIVAGDNPSMSQNMTIKANDGTTVTDAFVNFDLTKKDATSYEISWQGQSGAETFDHTVVVMRNGAACTVASAE